MKKLLSYILILIALVGIFGPITGQAADPLLGDCVEKLAAGVQGPVQTIPNTSQATCTSQHPGWIWNSNLRGKCTINSNGTTKVNDGWTESACKASNGTWAGPYVLLSPLPCDSGEGCADGKLTTFDPAGENKIGAYLNTMIRIFIGLCAILAVVMIVIGGIEYMTSELPGNKEHGKERIMGAIFGLILALGSWTILYQINPKILDTDLKSLKEVTVEVTLEEDLDSGPPSLSSFTGTLPSGSVGVCTGGVTQSKTTGIVACSSLSNNVDKMIADAKKAGLNIWGGGFRTLEQQTALRKKNCSNPNDSKTCKPATATPGTSRHESGLALDFACNGTTIQTKDNKCFLWLQSNASKYGLQNLKVGNEPWHWSTDGH